MNWREWIPWRREDRASGSYTDAVVAALQAQVSGLAADPGGVGAVEVAAGLWARGFASARVSPDSRTAASLTPSVLAAMGRGLVRDGEAVHLIQVKAGRVRLLQAVSWDVSGGWDPESWVYDLELGGPSRNESVRVEGESVVHVRYSTFPGQPWKGCSPLEWSRTTGKLSASLEGRMGEEASGPVGHLLPVPSDGGSGGEDDPLRQLKSDLAKLKGGIATVETTSGGWGEGRPAAPRRDWIASRIGASFPASNVDLRGSVHESVLAACGVPPSLALADSDGTGQREAWRRFLHGTLQPVAKLIREELALKLAEPSLRLDFGTLMASDLVGRARAYGSLTGDGEKLSKAEASVLCGFAIRN